MFGMLPFETPTAKKSRIHVLAFRRLLCLLSSAFTLLPKTNGDQPKMFAACCHSVSLCLLFLSTARPSIPFGSDTVHSLQRTNLQWAGIFIVNSYHIDTFIIYLHSKYYTYYYAYYFGILSKYGLWKKTCWPIFVYLKLPVICVRAYYCP